MPHRWQLIQRDFQSSESPVKKGWDGEAGNLRARGTGRDIPVMLER